MGQGRNVEGGVMVDLLPGTLLMASTFGAVFDETNRFITEIDRGDLVLYVGPFPGDPEWGYVCTPDGRYGRIYLKKGLKVVV